MTFRLLLRRVLVSCSCVFCVLLQECKHISINKVISTSAPDEVQMIEHFVRNSEFADYVRQLPVDLHHIL